MSRLYGYINITILQITVYVVGCNPFTNNLMPCPAHIPKYTLALYTKSRCHFTVTRNSANHLSTIASRGAPTDFIGLNNMNIEPTLSKMQSRRYSGKSSTNNTDISPYGTFKRLIIDMLISAGSVVRTGM